MFHDSILQKSDKLKENKVWCFSSHSNFTNLENIFKDLQHPYSPATNLQNGTAQDVKYLTGALFEQWNCFVIILLLTLLHFKYENDNSNNIYPLPSVTLDNFVIITR